MRKLSFLSILITLLTINLLAPSNTHAAGNFCCDGAAVYNSENQQCRSIADGRPTYYEPNPCAYENERCYGVDEGGPSQGICSEEKPVKCICPSYDRGARLIPSGICTNGSHSIVEDPICADSQASCINNYCVVGANTTLPVFNICNGLSGDQLGQCTTCLGDEDSRGVWTALGCIKVSPKDLIKDFLTIAITIAGGIALLLMIYGSFLISTSAGDPKKAEEGKEIITGTIAGLLFIIFSVVLLRLIGVEILNIPGL